MVTLPALEEQLVQPFRNEQQRQQQSAKRPWWLPMDPLLGFSVVLLLQQVDSVKDTAWNLVVTGVDATVRLFLGKLQPWLVHRMAVHNRHVLETTGIQVDVLLDSCIPIGVSVKRHGDPYKLSTANSLLVTAVATAGQLEKALGPRAAQQGATVLSVDGAVIRTSKEFRTAVADCDGTKCVVRLCLATTAHLAQLSTDWLVQKPVHRSNGTRSGASCGNRVVAALSQAVVPAPERESKRAAVPEPDRPLQRQAPSLEPAASNDSVLGGTAAAVAAATSKSNDAKNDLDAAYRVFNDKYREAVLIQYKSFAKFAMSQMWRHHKKSKYGPTCSGSCECLNVFPNLVAHIVQAKVNVESKKTDSKWERPTVSVGFLDVFVPKFLPYLKQTYPDDDAQLLLQRLCFMWRLHTKQLNFGLQCSASCDCLQGWSQVFRHGQTKRKDAPKGAALQQPLKSEAQGENVAHNEALSNVRIARKKAAPTLGTLGSMLACIQPSLSIPKKRKAPPAESQSLLQGMVPRLETTMLSVNDTGTTTEPPQPSRPPPIIATHAATSKRQVSASTRAPSPTLQPDTWVTVDSHRPIRRETPKPILKDSQGVTSKRTSGIRFDEDPIKELRFYEIGCKTTEFIVRATANADAATEATSRRNLALAHPYQRRPHVSGSGASLVDTIRDETVKDVISFFKQSKESGARLTERLNDAYKIVKDALTSLDAQLSSNPGDQALQRQYRDFDVKKNFIKICINAVYTFQVSRSLKNWVRFEITVTMIDQLELSDHAKVQGSVNMVNAEVSATYDPANSERLMNLPSKALSSRLEYESPHSYFMTYNVSIPPERILTFEIRNQPVKVASFELGTLVLKMSDLQKTCSQSGEWSTLTLDAEPNQFLLGAKVLIRARRIDLEPGYLEKKRTAQCIKVATVASWIQRFNADLSPEQSVDCRLSFQVGNVSLLKAAVYLEDDVLVKRLLDIDAYEADKSGTSSALSLAQNIADGIAKKTLDDEEDTDEPYDPIQDSRRRRLEIITLLLSNDLHWEEGRGDE